MRILRNISDEFWWDVARKCSYATFYHTPIWKELALHASPNYRDQTFGAILPSGVRVVFPMHRSRQFGPLRWLQSTFEGCYGGFIADGPVSPLEAGLIYSAACNWKTYSLYLLENPLAPPLPEEVKSKLTLLGGETSYTVNLDADFDTIFSRFSRTIRNSYRNGIKRGVHIRLANSLEDYRAYFPAYRDAVERWGKDHNYGYKWSLFEHCYHLSQRYPEHIKLWLMIVDEKIVGGRIAFYWNHQVTGWNGTAYREFLNHNVMPVADTEIIRDAIVRGFRYMDFNTSGGNQGVSDYKKRFGPVAMPVNMWLYKHPLCSAYKRVDPIQNKGLVMAFGTLGSEIMLSI